MKMDVTQKIPNSWIAYPAIITLMVYVFGYQFAYPFSSTFFLYIAFVCSIVWALSCQKIRLSNQMLLMGLLALVSAMGTLYTSMPVKGKREAILTVVVWVLMIAFAQSELLLEKLKRLVYLCSLVIFASVMVQYVFAGATNNLLKMVLRSDCYEQLMWSYNRDGAYAGLSAYTPDAAYFCATVFGFSAFNLLEGKVSTVKQKVLQVVIAAMSLFAIVLTSKRGIALALVLAFLFTYMVWKKMSVKTVVGVVFLILIGVAVLSVLAEQNEAVAAFLQRFENTDGDITTGRTEIWRHAWERLTNGWIGMGTGATYEIAESGMHNIYLQLYFDHGFIGTAIYLIFFVNNLKYAIKRKEPLAIYIQLLMLVYGMSGNPIYSNSFFIVYIIFSVVSVDLLKKKGPIQSHPSL